MISTILLISTVLCVIGLAFVMYKQYQTSISDLEKIGKLEQQCHRLRFALETANYVAREGLVYIPKIENEVHQYDKKMEFVQKVLNDQP